MPEGPSIVILKEEAQIFEGKKIRHVSGNAKIDLPRLHSKKILHFKSWGKHFLICFDNFFIKIHLLMFGSYRINEEKEYAPRLHLAFSNGELNFYSCSVKLIEGNPDDVYDWEVDTMSDDWNPQKAFAALKLQKDVLICDALLDQEIFSGVGNIIKNEVLFLEKIHPETKTTALSEKKLKALIKTTRSYCFSFYKWKKAFVLKKHWLVHRCKVCSVCDSKITAKYLGTRDRITYYCSHCQAAPSLAKRTSLRLRSVTRERAN